MWPQTTMRDAVLVKQVPAQLVGALLFLGGTTRPWMGKGVPITVPWLVPQPPYH